MGKKESDKSRHKPTNSDTTLNTEIILPTGKITNKIIARKLGCSERTVERWGKEKAIERYKEYIIDESATKQILEQKVSSLELVQELKDLLVEQMIMDIEITSSIVNTLDKEDRANYRLELMKAILRSG